MSPRDVVARRLAAVWFADIVGYTRLAAEDENAALEAVDTFQDAVREVVESNRGRLVKFMGDAALAEFPTAASAVAAGLGLAGSFGSRLVAEGRPQVAARVGVHVGEIAPTPDGDVLGEDVNLASRIHTTAGPGQVVVSEDVARQMHRHRGVALEPLGERELKGVPELTRLYVASPAGAASLRASTASRPRSIAVLPFANLSPDPANEYFSDGVTEEILTSLARIDGLKVTSRTSVMRYKGVQRSLPQIGEELGVATILEGSVRRAGNRVRITTQLIDTATDEHLWAERYDRDLEDIFAIQADVADRIVAALRLRLTPGARERLAGAPTRDLKAYQHYLRGVHFWNRRERAAARLAQREYEAAIELDPSYAQAWAGLASLHAMITDWDPVKARERLRRAIEAAERALALDPGLGVAYAALGEIRLRESSWDEAERSFERAIELGPNHATAHQWYAHYLAAMGRFDEAGREIGRALELDPLSLPVLTEAGNVLLYERRFDEAVSRYRSALDLDPTFLPAGFRLADLFEVMGRGEESIAEWRRFGVRRSGAGADRDGYVESALAIANEKGAPPVFLAAMCAVAGRADQAFEYLEHGLSILDWTLVSLRVHPLFDSLRDDPRFARVLERCRLAA